MLRPLFAAFLALSVPVDAQTGVSFPGPGFPMSIGTNLQGLLIFCSTDFAGSSWVGYLTPNGNLVDTAPATATQGLVNGVATDGGTAVFVVDSPISGGGNGEVDVYDLAGNHLQSFPVPTPNPTGIAYNFATGTIFVTDVDTVYEFEFLDGPIGSPLGSVVLQGTAGITGITWDVVHDTYWVHDEATDELRTYDAAFQPLMTTSFAWPAGDTHGLAFLEGKQSVYMVEPFTAQELVVIGVASSVSFGAGCGAQPLTLDVNRPVFGMTMSMVLSSVPSSPIGSAILLGVTVPGLSLDVIGAPGCVLRSGAEIAAVPLQGGASQLDVAIPATSVDLIGIFLFAQGAVVDAVSGLATTNGVRLTVGAI